MRKLVWTMSASILVIALGLAALDRTPPIVVQADGNPPGPIFPIEPSSKVDVTPELLTAGEASYMANCAACHGTTGDGNGLASYLLYPRPRNLKKAKYRFVSTWEGDPTDVDLYRVVSRGVPGSAMPSWAHLDERVRWGLVHYVKSLAQNPIEVAPTDPKAKEGVIEPSPEPADDAASLARGRQLFQETCAQCHGPSGKGDGANAATLVDGDGFPIRPRDLTTGVFKGSPLGEHLFRRIRGGIRGTPMPSSGSLPPEDIWHLVHFVRSMSSERLRDRAEMKRYRIDAVRVATVPDHPDAGAWREVPKTELHLMPLWWRYDRPEYLVVKACHDGKALALLLMWEDATENNRTIRPQDFRDAAAIELSAAADPPFFAMGATGNFVNIWMWKAERQRDLTGFHDLEAEYPDIGIDAYPNSTLAPYEQPLRHALTIESDRTFVTAWAAGNIVANPLRLSAVEDLFAQGFGTLKARETQQAGGFGVYDHGSHRVMFARALTAAGDGAFTFEPGKTLSIGFAVWNGAAQDRDGMKSVTIWQELVLAK